MKKNEVLFEAIKATLIRHSSAIRGAMKWRSQTTYKAEAVHIGWWSLRMLSGWTQERSDLADLRIKNQIANDSRWNHIDSLLLEQDNLVSYVRPSKTNLSTDLLIGTNFGWWFVGIKTHVEGTEYIPSTTTTPPASTPYGPARSTR